MADFLIVRLSSLGDIIHALPAFAALRRSFPRARIRWAVGPTGREILELVPGLDETIVIGRKIWLRNIRALRRRGQIALDFQGLVKSALLAFLSGSSEIAGFSRENCREPLAASFYNRRLPPFSEENLHVITKNLRLLSLVDVREERYEFPLVIPEGLRRSVAAKLARLGYEAGQKLVLLNVGAAWPTKRWFAEGWAALLEAVKFEDAFPLILWGTPGERSLALAISGRTGTPVAPFLSIREVFGLLRMTALLVSGDTFVLQAACAMDVPVVGLFGPTSPGRNGPFAERDRVIYAGVSCAPCYKRVCPTLDCLQTITVEGVAAAVRELWSKAVAP